MSTALHDDRGSLPMALLAVIVLTGVVTVLVATVVTGQRQTRFDQNFEQALPVAEIGLNQVSYLIETGQLVAPAAPALARQEVGVVDGTTDDGERYETTAYWLRDERSWELVSTGTARDGTQRTVTVDVAITGLFQQAAFGKLFADFNGGNGADSFRSGTLSDTTFTPTPGGTNICRYGSGGRANPFASSDSSVWMCNRTGNGIIATNGELFLKGQTIERADGAEVHYSTHADKLAPLEPLPTATGRCKGVPEVCSSPKLSHHRPPMPVDFDPVELPAPSQGDFPGTDPTPAPLADAGPRHPPRPDPEPCALPGGPAPPSGPYTACVGPGVHVFQNVTLDSSTHIQGTPEDPTIIYLSGALEIPNQAVVNFERQAGHWVPRPSPSLLIFSAGTGPALDFGNHASISAAIHAPNTGFVGGAQGNVYGALVAGSINNNGGWNFHFDEALRDVAVNGDPRRSRWAESP